ncbi:c-type cytochrome [Massilia sp. PWRC2]|uniref:c-type cytochrome n=1 Tax=Massilia sp. PWRC2 TaxID=2804626 RepID=UPI003CE7F33E
MSDAHNESAIRTPKQLVAAVAGFFLVTVIGIILLVSFVTTEKLTGAGSDSQDSKAIVARLQPVADAGYTFRDASAPKVLQSGEAVFAAICAACHASGAAGAPKLGDSAGWAARIGQGYDILVKHAIEGIRAMPAKGGNPDLDDIEVARAVVYMTNKSGAAFKEPVAPAPASSAGAAEAAPAAAVTPVAVAPAAAAAAVTVPAILASADSGKKIYDGACVACHGAGIAGAPKFADKAAWAPRLAQGNAVLYEHAIKGFQGKAGVMPAKGGSSATDAEVKAAVDYLASAAK